MDQDEQDIQLPRGPNMTGEEATAHASSQSTEQVDLQNLPESEPAEPIHEDGSAPVTDGLIHRNVVFFGETGVGKSAIINMLREEAEEEFDVATVSNAAIGCTLTNTCYPLRLGEDVYNLWDTAGLIEGGFGSVTAGEAEHNLSRLLQTTGVNLLVYCVRGRRYRNVIEENYKLFFENICQKVVPIVLVVTGLENENDMEDWWTMNQVEFSRRNMRFNGHACITSTRGKEMKAGGCMFDEEYEASLKVIRSVVTANCLPEGFQCPISGIKQKTKPGYIKARINSMLGYS